MSRTVVSSNPLDRNISRAASRIFRSVTSALGETFDGTLFLNMFKYYLPSLGLSMAILNMFNTTLPGDGKRRTNAVLELHMYGNRVNQALGVPGTSARVTVSHIQPQDWRVANMMRI